MEMEMEELFMMAEPPEVDAAYILIQLSGDSQYPHIIADRGSSSSCSKAQSTSFEEEDEDRYYLAAMSKANNEAAAADTNESVGDCATSSTASAAARDDDDRKILDPDGLSSSEPVIVMKRDDVDAKVISVEGCGEIEGYPWRKKSKFRSIVDLYANTNPSGVGVGDRRPNKKSKEKK